MGVNWVSNSFSSHCIIHKIWTLGCPKDTRTPLWLKACIALNTSMSCPTLLQTQSIFTVERMWSKKANLDIYEQDGIQDTMYTFLCLCLCICVVCWSSFIIYSLITPPPFQTHRHTHITCLHFLNQILYCKYSQLCPSRICWDWRNSFDLEKIRLMSG